MLWHSAALTHVGRVRKLNEDAVLDRPDIGLWAVADGVGGAAAGDWASAFTIQALASIARPATGFEFLSGVRQQLSSVNIALRRRADVEGQSAIATTVVVLMFFDQHFACAWAGDSRLYLRRGGLLSQLSRDHSAVQDLVDSGVISAADARSHPKNNVITRAVGAQEKLELDTLHDRLLENDVFLLCSDGLTKTMDEAEIATVLDEPVDRAAARMIDTALDRGAPDNVTVVVVRVLPSI
jgi:serine/threonine protein phosphatase Stp1